MFTILKKNETLAVKAYRGDAMTLLAFDLLRETDRNNFVGFTIEFRNATIPVFLPLRNRITFEPIPQNISESEQIKLKSSRLAPFQKFRWIHVLRNFTANNDIPFFGAYEYRITPRWWINNALDDFNQATAKSITIKIDVKPFEKEGLQIAFTRGFLVSQAYSDRFGPNPDIRPFRSELLFDPKTMQNEIFKKPLLPGFPTTPYTYEEQYAWMGFNARKAVYDFIDEVVNDPNKSMDVLAYDFSEPVIAKNLIELSRQGRLRMLLDNHDEADAVDNGGKKSDPEYKKEFASKFDSSTGSLLFRHKFSRLAHCKILIQKDKTTGKAIKVLTGSTNFTLNGLYINANHILILTQPDALTFYEQLFNESIVTGGNKNFSKTELAAGIKPISTSPKMSVGFSPHKRDVALEILQKINDKINTAEKSVLFAVMELKSEGSVTATLRKIHAREDIFTMGITDSSHKNEETQIRLYDPKKKTGVLVNGKKNPKVLPPPFEAEASPGLVHQVHHKFVVVDFNTPNAAVFCGSSNLAQGGEEQNGDNLLIIEDQDIASVFAIEAIRLIDHYQFRNRENEASAPLLLKKDNEWYKRYFDPENLYCLDKQVFIGE